jgi:hypothetical protein
MTDNNTVAPGGGVESEDKGQQLPEFIGTAWIEADGTIKMRLHSTDRHLRGGTTLIYPVDHKDYGNILAHIGPIRLGDKVSVRPWVD